MDHSGPVEWWHAVLTTAVVAHTLLTVVEWCLSLSGALTLTANLVVFGILGTIALGVRLRHGPRSTTWTPSAFSWPELAGWALLALGVSAMAPPVARAMRVAVAPNSDAPIYHLLFAARWLQEGRIFIVPTPFGDNAAAYTPAGGELVFLWWMLPFHADTVAKVGQAPFLLLAAVAQYGLGRRLGFGPAGAMLPPGLLLAAGVFVAEATVANVDLVLLAFYLTSAYFLVGCLQCFGRRRWLCAGLALGCTLSTKYVALVFVVPLVPLAVAAVGRHVRASVHRGVGWLLALGLAAAAPCAWWYGRNWIVTGNPLYPVAVRVAGVTLFDGAYARSAVAQAGPDEPHIHHVPTDRLEVLAAMLVLTAGLLPGCLTLAGLVSAVPGLRRGRQPLLRAYLLAMPALHVLLVWYVLPYQNQIRFLYPGVAAGYLAAGYLTREPLTWLAALAAGAYAMLRGQPDLRLCPEWSTSLSPTLPFSWPTVLAAAAWLAGALVVRWRRSRPVGLWVVAGLVSAWLVAGAAGAAWLPERDQPTAVAVLLGSPDPYVRQSAAAWIELQRLTGLEDRPAVVAYAGNNVVYPLCGTHLRTRVIHVNINRFRDFQFHDYVRHYKQLGQYRLPDHPKPVPERMEKDPRAWVENLRAAQADYLFVGQMNAWEQRWVEHDEEGFPIERTWADDPGLGFQLVYADRFARIYRVPR